ncbi:MAG: RDD family protein [Armatimonadetes bacterium]|nr:RDD family protein [Armatimonadota bacterium]
MDYEQVTVETPEYVSISYELAGPGSRLMAAVLDHLIIALAISAILLLGLGLKVGLPRASAPMVVLAIVAGGPLLLLALYFVAFEVAWGGQTPGKRAAGLRVMRDDGTPATTIDLLIRNTVRVVDFLPYLYFLGGLVAFVHRQSKRLGDLAAGTVVVKLRQTALPDAIQPPAAEAEATDGLAPMLRPLAASLTPEERGTVQRFLERRFELEADVRAEMSRRLIDALRSRLAPEIAELADTEPERLLEALAQACSVTGDRF